MKLVAVVTVLLLAGLVPVAVARTARLRSEAPPEWKMGERAAPESFVEFRFALKQRNLGELTERFWAIANPKSPRYQQFMSVKEVQDLVAPLPSEKAPVLEWLHDHGLRCDAVVDLGDCIKVSTTVALAESLLHTQFYSFAHAETRETILRPMGSFSFSDALDSVIEFVSNLAEFPVPHLSVHSPSLVKPWPNEIGMGLAPQTIMQVYNVSFPAAGGPPTSQGVVNFEPSSYTDRDLTLFSNLTGIFIPRVRVVGPNPQKHSYEGNMDIQWIAGVNNQAESWYWYNSKLRKWLFDWATDFNTAQSRPQVISISYAWSESDQCNGDISYDACESMGIDSYTYVRRVNTEFQKMAALGVSVIVASGDSGTHGRTDMICAKTELFPDFPASSPYVTAVGGTELINEQPLANQPPLCARYEHGCASNGTETAVSWPRTRFSSGGGFSNVENRPDYQSQVVDKYLNSGVRLPTHRFNNRGRGYPDVSSLGHNCLTLVDGIVVPLGGTSCSAPIFASLIAFLNQAAIKKTGKQLGFLNPLLYQMYKEDPRTFKDITEGDNHCSEAGCYPQCVNQGFFAAPGWDAVTGLGSPNYGAMLRYINK